MKKVSLLMLFAAYLFGYGISAYAAEITTPKSGLETGIVKNADVISDAVNMGKLESKLGAQLEGTGIKVLRQANTMLLIMPSHLIFTSGAINIMTKFYPVLDSIALVFNEFKESNIKIAAYTDSTGTELLNQVLSEQRASSVASYIVNKGMNQRRIQTKGFGSLHPIASNDTVQGREENRRVEISISPQ